jgi:type II secretory pathway component PulK
MKIELMVRQAHHKKDDGVVLLIVIFVIALLSAVAIGMLQLNTEDIQLVQNQINAAQAIATAEAGLNDAFSRIWLGNDPNISSTPFNGGSYTVTASGNTLTSTGTTAQGFVARVKADITIGTTSPYIIRIDSLRINE